jgi:hypothetical protein
MAPPEKMLDLVDSVDALVQEREFATLGDRIVIVAGAALGTPGTVNGIIIHTVGERWTGEVDHHLAGDQVVDTAWK